MTGVQTCALPIWPRLGSDRSVHWMPIQRQREEGAYQAAPRRRNGCRRRRWADAEGTDATERLRRGEGWSRARRALGIPMEVTAPPPEARRARELAETVATGLRLAAALLGPGGEGEKGADVEGGTLLWVLVADRGRASGWRDYRRRGRRRRGPARVTVTSGWGPRVSGEAMQVGMTGEPHLSARGKRERGPRGLLRPAGCWAWPDFFSFLICISFPFFPFSVLFNS